LSRDLKLSDFKMEQPGPNSRKGVEELCVEDINAQDKEEANVEKRILGVGDHHGVDAGPQKWNLTAALAVVFLGLTWIGECAAGCVAMDINSLSLPVTGAQLPLYFMVGPMAYIVADVNAGKKASWIPLAYVLAQGTPVPFAGYIQDIVGRRWMTLIASLSVAIGAVLIGTAHSFPHAVSGSALAGAGGGIAELGAIAG
jgi:MFS family permease